MPDKEEFLRDELIRSLRAEPLLVESEKSIHSQADMVMQERLRLDLAKSLSAQPLFKDQDRGVFHRFEPEIISRFRSILRASLSSEPSLAEGEEELLETLGFEKLGEFRSTVRAQLETPAAIPEENLAIYITDPKSGGSLLAGIRKAINDVESATDPAELDFDENELKASVSELLGILETQEKEDTSETRQQEIIPSVPEEGFSVPPAEDAAASDVTEGLRAALVAVEGEDEAAAEVLHFAAPTPLTLLTAALESAGVKEDGFGFVLRYGCYASEARESEYIVGGLGMAELSRRLTVWLEARRAENCQVQVVDDGTGELALYLSSQEVEE